MTIFTDWKELSMFSTVAETEYYKAKIDLEWRSGIKYYVANVCFELGGLPMNTRPKAFRSMGEAKESCETAAKRLDALK